MGKVDSDSVAQDQLRAFVERIERMEEEKASIAEDIKQIYAEAKGNGFDTKILRMVVRIRKMDANERLEQEALLELYLSALGMGTPIEAAAMDAEQKAKVSFGKAKRAGRRKKAAAPHDAVGFDVGAGA